MIIMRELIKYQIEHLKTRIYLIIKIVCNHAEYITDLATGYVFGVPISYSGEGADALNINFTEIDEDSHNNELALDLSIFGRTYELIYMNTDEKPKIELASLSPLNTFLVVDTSVKEKPMFAVHYYPNITLENTIDNYTVEVYTETEKLIYEITSLQTRTFKQLQKKIQKNISLKGYQ